MCVRERERGGGYGTLRPFTPRRGPRREGFNRGSGAAARRCGGIVNVPPKSSPAAPSGCRRAGVARATSGSTSGSTAVARSARLCPESHSVPFHTKPGGAPIRWAPAVEVHTPASKEMPGGAPSRSSGELPNHSSTLAAAARRARPTERRGRVSGGGGERRRGGEGVRERERERERGAVRHPSGLHAAARREASTRRSGGGAAARRSS